MGKAYQKELQNLYSTYDWAIAVPINELRSFVRASWSLPLLSIGSGGSLTSAIFVSLLHQETGNLSASLTPLDIVSSCYRLNEMAVLFLTAEGRNSDLCLSLKKVAKSEPRQLMVLCASVGSPAKRIASEYRYVHFSEFEIPSGKDGFVATNSLMGFVMLLIRAYTESSRLGFGIPSSLEDLVHPDASRLQFLTQLENAAQSIASKDTLTVLYGKWGKPAALDLESKLTESGLNNAQLADYRNFAHGRHIWLAKKGDRTGIVALITHDDKKIAEKTLDLIPKEIPILRMSTSEAGPLAAVKLLVETMCLVGIIGKSAGQDPGRPVVPEFGRRIYNLRIPSNMRKMPAILDLSELETAAILRKARYGPEVFCVHDLTAFWINAHREFVRDLQQARYGSVVFDYDGTLCDPRERFTGISAQMGQKIAHLLEKQVIVGVATGRGKSVREDLQRILPRECWSQVLIGYYNGSDIARLDDGAKPDKSLSIDPVLGTYVEALKEQTSFEYTAKLKCRPKQLTLEPIGTFTIERLMQTLRDVAEKNNLDGIQILESNHTVDVLAPHVSKVDLVKAVHSEAEGNGKVAETLCIGDKGMWPGNDFALLSEQYSLSVDTVSTDPDTCWNIAPPGHQGVQSTLDYLETLDFEKSLIRFCYNRLRGRFV